MRIDPKVEAPTRDLLDHAMKGELDKIASTVQTIGDPQRYRQCIGLCALIAGYIAIDVCGSQWPTETDLRKVADNMARLTTRYTLDASQIYEYLSRSALRSEPLDQVFPSFEEAANLPVLMTASLIVTYCAPGKGVWEYLDEIESGIEAADDVSPNVLPALILRAHMTGPTAEQ